MRGLFENSPVCFITSQVPKILSTHRTVKEKERFNCLFSNSPSSFVAALKVSSEGNIRIYF